MKKYISILLSLLMVFTTAFTCSVYAAGEVVLATPEGISWEEGSTATATCGPMSRFSTN